MFKLGFKDTLKSFFSYLKSVLSSIIVADSSGDCQKCISKIRFQVIVLAVAIVIFREGFMVLLSAIGLV